MGFTPGHGGLFTSEHMAQLQSKQSGEQWRGEGFGVEQRCVVRSSLFTPEQEASLGLRPATSSVAVQAGSAPPATQPKRGPTLELEGYSLSTTPSGLSVLVPTGTRKVTIEDPSTESI